MTPLEIYLTKKTRVLENILSGYSSGAQGVVAAGYNELQRLRNSDDQAEIDQYLNQQKDLHDDLVRTAQHVVSLLEEWRRTR